MRLELTKRESTTVLAALRSWQADLYDNPDGPITDHFVDETPLTVEEIDELIERINVNENPRKREQ